MPLRLQILLPLVESKLFRVSCTSIIIGCSYLSYKIWKANRIKYFIDNEKSKTFVYEFNIIEWLEQITESTNENNSEIKQYFNDGSQIVLKNPSIVYEKIKNIRKHGAKKIQVIADFDGTIGKYKNSGCLVPTTHGVIEGYSSMSPEDRKYFRSLYETYYPIEIDHNLTHDEKTPFMIEWWKKSHALITQIGVNKDQLNHLVENSGVVLREGCEAWFRILNQYKVPCLVFSAGIGNIIEEVFKNLDLLLPNMLTVSNFMTFDSQGIVTGFQPPLIHIFSKSTSSLRDTTAYDVLSHRPNVLLFGDSTGDLHMADGCSDFAETVLRIGFLNDKVEERLSFYLDNYDMVLIDDETFRVPLAILRAVL